MPTPLTFEALAKGGAVERLHQEIHKTLDNIVDPNTSAKARRKIKLEIFIKPNELRNAGVVEITASSTLPPYSPIVTQIIIDKDDDGKAVAAELGTDETRGATPLPGMEDDAQSGKIAKLNHKAKEA
jgi:hypothetical protein